jgi:hypothetical protein
MGKGKAKSTRTQELEGKTNVKKSSTSSSPPTIAQPLVSQQALHSDEHDILIARSGKSRQGTPSEGSTAHTSMKRKRNHGHDTLNHPAKVTRRENDGEMLKSHMGQAPETPNTVSPPNKCSEPHNTNTARHHSQHESVHPLPPLSKFAVIQWANQLGSSAYLRDMGKADRRNYIMLIDTLSAVNTHRDHQSLTLKMLKETKLAMEVHKFVDHRSYSPESTLADEIYTHWQSKFRF